MRILRALVIALMTYVAFIAAVQAAFEYECASHVFHDTFTDVEGTLCTLTHTPDDAINGVTWREHGFTDTPIRSNRLSPTAASTGGHSVAYNVGETAIGVVLPYKVTMVALNKNSGVASSGMYVRLSSDNVSTYGDVTISLGTFSTFAQDSVAVEVVGEDGVAYGEDEQLITNNAEQQIEVLFEATQFTLTVNGVARTPVVVDCPADAVYLVANFAFAAGVADGSYIDLLGICNMPFAQTVAVGLATETDTALAMTVVATTPYIEPELLLHFDGSGGSTTFTDSSLIGRTVTVGTGAPELTTADKKFGTASCEFAVGSSRVDCGDGYDFSGDFSVSFWFRHTNEATVGQVLCSLLGGSGITYWYIVKTTNGTNSSVGCNIMGQSISPTTYPLSASGDFAHVELSRSGSTMYLFLNGALVGTGGDSGTDPATTRVLAIGDDTSVGNEFSGQIDDFVVTIGAALHTAEFTPPTDAYTDP